MKYYPLAALSLALGAQGLMAEEATIRVEDTGLGNPAQVAWPPEDIRPGPSADSGELLRNIPGVSGNRMGGRGIDPIIRGQGQTRLNILLDGAYVHGGCPNRMDPPTGYASEGSYDKITVIKGSHSVEYGSGGSGGTVIFERETPRFGDQEPLRTEVFAGFKSNSNTKDIGVDIAAGGPSGFARGIVSYTDADNYEDGDGNTVRTAYTTTDGTVILGYTPDDATRLEFSYDAVREDDVLYAGSAMDAPYSDMDTLRLHFKRDTDIGPFSAIKAEVYNAEVDHLMDNFSLRELTPATKMRVPTSSDTFGGRVSADMKTATGTTWTFGVDHQDIQRNANRFTGPAAGADPQNLQSIMWPDAELQQTGLFAQMATPVRGQDTVKAGLRYDRVEASASRADATAQVSPMMARSPNQLYQLYYGRGADDHGEDNVGGFLTYEHPLNENTALFGTLSRSVRTADATERYLAGDNAMLAASRWVGNPGLDPEKHHQAELGITTNRAGWDASASLYYNDVSDYILRDRAHAQDGILLNDSATIYRNIDATLYGAEIEGGMRWGDNWSGRMTLAYVRAENDTDSRPIAQTPPLEATVSLNYTSGKWTVGGILRAQAKQNRVEDDPATDSGLDARQTPSWNTLDLYGTYAVSDAVTLKAGIDNVLDRTYAYHVNRANADPFNPDAVQVNEPGRAIWLKLNASF